jgi:plasmid stabilization system protein ParE
MGKQELVAEILSLPVEERIEVAEAIWASISAVPAAPYRLAEGGARSSLGVRMASIAAFPDANRIIYRQIRRAVVSRFPYLIFYVPKGERVDVLAVLHHARNPADWPSR